ncbi:endonuclease/exonuclease/phosphatase family protein [Acanthopleuribacter pedis]|uniref:Endonuclease/exonuclease/phosphatase family protein n=1 Tax=Acanthopleuribacter pedis TaxID=442870 RepID=A0A8J7QN78_9BACT|nr:endonuclease/exonuclease/phosphatase family protein [Acanthopleuribacter pedis]MBO1321518.1 endonuclease/exonuclease/phosphatase family protein [Acanthopleuribacter pedis]
MNQPCTIKILSYNIHKGFSTYNRNYVLDRIRLAIKQVHADVVFLQEVLGDHQRHSQRIPNWPDAPQFEYLADSVWHHYAYGKNAVYDAGHHGNAILSKYPISDWDNIDVSTNPLENRGLLHAVLAVPEFKMPLHVICLHLDLLERGRRLQVGLLTERIRSVVPDSEPLIIAGDFNDWRERISDRMQRELNLQEAHFDLHDKHARTFPSWMPLLKLDRVYFRGFRAVDARVMKGEPWRQLSDHAAYFSELQLVEDA